MATVPYTIVEDKRHTLFAIIIRWTLGGGDDGQPFDGVDWPDKTVHLEGTFGANVSIQGSNELPTPTNWRTLRDPLGTLLTFTSSDLKTIMENPYWIRPLAGAITSVTITLTCSRSRR